MKLKKEKIFYIHVLSCVEKINNEKTQMEAKEKPRPKRTCFFINKEIKDLKNYQVFDNRELETKAESET